MEKGSRLAIYKLKEVQPNEGEKFYIATVVEMVYNSQRVSANKYEPSFMKAYLFGVDFELEVADFSGDKNKTKYSYENITNPEKSIIRVEEFKVETKSKWNFGKPLSQNGSPVYETIAYLTKVCRDKDYRTDNAKEKMVQKQIEKLESTIEKKNERIKELQKEIRKLKNKIIKQEEVIHEAKVELNIIPENKVNQKVRVKEFGDVSFEDM